MRICVFANSARYIWNFRINLMKALSAEGHEVIAISPGGKEVALIESSGFRHVHLFMAPRGVNLFLEISTIWRLRKLLKNLVVDVVLSSTPKGNFYTALASYRSHRYQIANVSGLGSAFLRGGWLSWVITVLYRITFRRIHHVLFENPVDYGEFLDHGWVDVINASKIPGLGVDLNYFQEQPWPIEQDVNRIRFLMISRLIGDKGVREYMEAARIVRKDYPNVNFELLGDSASDNLTRISLNELNMWLSQGDVVHYEHVNDVRPFIKRAHCVVLPSYREGMSRTLLEGAAMGRPLIATNVPGCSEAIDVGVNGYLCEARSVDSLVQAMTQFLNLNMSEQKKMGHASRQKIISEFSEQVVIQRYVALINKLR